MCFMLSCFAELLWRFLWKVCFFEETLFFISCLLNKADESRFEEECETRKVNDPNPTLTSSTGLFTCRFLCAVRLQSITQEVNELLKSHAEVETELQRIDKLCQSNQQPAVVEVANIRVSETLEELKAARVTLRRFVETNCSKISALRFERDQTLFAFLECKELFGEFDESCIDPAHFFGYFQRFCCDWKAAVEFVKKDDEVASCKTEDLEQLFVPASDRGLLYNAVNVTRELLLLRAKRKRASAQIGKLPGLTQAKQDSKEQQISLSSMNLEDMLYAMKTVGFIKRWSHFVKLTLNFAHWSHHFIHNS